MEQTSIGVVINREGGGSVRVLIGVGNIRRIGIE
jgi:hypothetical protein